MFFFSGKGAVIGILKAGYKRLFLNVSDMFQPPYEWEQWYRPVTWTGTHLLTPLWLFTQDPSGVPHEVEPLCVLDFYVHESRQRSGCGRKLFEAMMQVSDSLVSLLSDLGWFTLREVVGVCCMGPAFSMKYIVYSVGQSLGMKLSQTL